MDPARPVTWPKFTRFRGDTKRLPFALVDMGAPFNPVGHVLLFTLKDDPADADVDARIQKISTVGGFFVVDAAAGKIEVELLPADDADLELGVAYPCDVQAQNQSTGAVKTVGRATLKLTVDITRDPSLSVPTFTTFPPIDISEEPETMQLAPAAIDLGSGRFLHLLPDGTATYADAAAGRPAHGYTREAVVDGATVSMRVGGKLTGLSGLTPGAVYYLSATTPGVAVVAPPATGFVQRLGTASTPDTLLVAIEPPILLD